MSSAESQPPAPLNPARQATADSGERVGQLEYRWWASNGPTGGYLARLALDTACRWADRHAGAVRSVDLHVLRLTVAGPYTTVTSALRGQASVTAATVTFNQDHPFALATVHFVPEHAGTSSVASDLEPPAALPAPAYSPMNLDHGSFPPVMYQFTHRPTTGFEDEIPRPGWDCVWTSPNRHPWSGRADALNTLDCWYPPAYAQAVRRYLDDPRSELADPPPANLISLQAHFTATTVQYDDLEPVLVANRVAATADGHWFEQSELWSQHGQLLLQAQIVRRHQQSR